MKFDSDKHHRRSVRLKDYDYAQAGAYFVTICAYQRESLFGEIINGAVQLNTGGGIVHDCWLRIESLRANVILDTFVVMPNHFHAILFITDTPDELWRPTSVTTLVGAHRDAPTLYRF